MLRNLITIVRIKKCLGLDYQTCVLATRISIEVPSDQRHVRISICLPSDCQMNSDNCWLSTSRARGYLARHNCDIWRQFVIKTATNVVDVVGGFTTIYYNLLADTI